MLILDIEINNRKKELTLYQLPKKQMIGKVNSLEIKDLCLFLIERRLPVKIITLDMYKPYVELLYGIYPDSLICIEPCYVKKLFEKSIEARTDQTYFSEEVAAALDPSIDYFNRSLLSEFITNFYTCNTAEEAMSLYNVWQTYIPLNQPKFYKFVRTIEFYKKEIFNYFELKKILAASR